jgi:type I restriction enzyme S subunit
MTELPKGWALTTVHELAETSLGKMLDAKQQTGEHPTPYLRNINVRWGSFDLSDIAEMDVAPHELGRVLAQPGDVIACEGGEPGRAAVWRGEPIAIQKALHRIRPAAGISPDYLAYGLRAAGSTKQLDRLFTGTTIKHLPQEKLRQVQIALPPTAEQERIVTAIEEAFSKLDAGEAGLRVVRQLLKRMREAILTAAVTGRLVPQEPTDTPVAKLLADLGVQAAEPDGVPELPPSWAWTELGVIADVVGGVTKDSKRQSDPSFVEVPYLRVANVQRGFLDLETITTIRVAPEKAAQLELRTGDVLFNEGGDRDKLGRGWVWEGQIASCIHQNHVFRARLSDGVEPKLVSIWGNTFGRGWFETRGKQTTNLASLNLKTLKAFPVPVAPVEEQPRILAEVERQMSFLGACERAVGTGLARSAGLRRSVLKAAFAGRLVPQDPSDEPAPVLLERIRAERAAQPVVNRRARRTA